MVLSNLLFEGPNSPIYKKIIESELAPSYCPGYGFDYTTKESTFTMGV
jgi:Zn-dependent M16 (insulinase) family peptidase